VGALTAGDSSKKKPLVSSRKKGPGVGELSGMGGKSLGAENKGRLRPERKKKARLTKRRQGEPTMTGRKPKMEQTTEKKKKEGQTFPRKVAVSSPAGRGKGD